MGKYRKGKYKKKKEHRGLRVDVRNNNVEGALKIFKRMVKNSGMLLELKEKQYYTKPSKKRRERRNMAKLRNKYQIQKEQSNY